MKRESLLIEPRELLAKLGQENLRIFDASVGAQPYWEGHIRGAAFFNHERFSDPASPYDTTILQPAALIQRVGESGIGNDSEVVVYASGMIPYAARAWWVLRYAGHDNVRVLNGGLAAWQAIGGPIETTERTYAPTTFVGRPRPELFADKEEVQAALGNPGQAVIDVLPQASYDAAHITGSTCASCFEVMQGMDAFRPTDEIAAHLGDANRDKRIITYCGGGIAAALSGMAYLLIGHDDVAVYDGSLYEWIAEELPMTGSGDWEIWKR